MNQGSDMAGQLLRKKRRSWFKACALLWILIALWLYYQSVHSRTHYSTDVSLVLVASTFLAALVYAAGIAWISLRAPSIRREVHAQHSPPPMYLPNGFIKRNGEHVLFSTDTYCALPVLQTTTYGVLGGLGAADSTSKTVIGERKSGFLTITSQRIVANAKGDIREWPITSISGAYSANPKTLVLQVPNAGTAEFSWALPYAKLAAQAITTAASGEWSTSS